MKFELEPNEQAKLHLVDLLQTARKLSTEERQELRSNVIQLFNG